MKLKITILAAVLLTSIGVKAQSPVYATKVNVRDSVVSLENDTDLYLYGKGDGTINIEGEYTIPSKDGNSGQAFITDGAGSVTFQDIPTSASGITVDDTGFTVVHGVDVQSTFADIDQELLTKTTTGIEYGGVLSINGGNPATFNVTAGKAELLNDSDPLNPVYIDIEWTAKTAVSPAFSDVVTYLYFDDNSNVLKQTTTAPTREDRREKVWIGRVTLTGGAIVGIANDRDFTRQLAPQLRDVAEAVGLSKLNGLVISANGANLSFDRSAGDLFDFGSNGQESPHTKEFSSVVPQDFFYLTRNAQVGSSRTTIDPNNYDNGGVVTSVSVNKYTIQDIYLFSSNLVRLQYGQTEYNSLSEAIEGITNRTYVPAPGTELGLRLGWIVVKQGTVSLQNTANSRIIQANKKGDIGGGISLEVGALIAANNLSDVDNLLTSQQNLELEKGVDVQAWDTDLDALSGVGTTGFLVRTGSGTALTRSLTEGNGIDISNPDGVALSPTISAESASTTNQGVVELATVAETNTGASSTLGVTPAGLSGWTGSSSISTLGTISSGTWNGTAITDTYLDGISASKVGSGTPNQIGVFDGSGFLSGYSTFTYNGTTLGVGGVTTNRFSLFPTEATFTGVGSLTGNRYIIKSGASTGLDATGQSSTTGVSTSIFAETSNDTGSNPLMVLDSRTTSDGGIVTRPLLEVRNNGTSILNIAASGYADFTTTNAVNVSNGTTAQRPSGTNGDIRYNTTLAKLEAYENGAWKDMITGTSGFGIGANEIAYGDGSGGIISIPNFQYRNPLDQWLDLQTSSTINGTYFLARRVDNTQQASIGVNDEVGSFSNIPRVLGNADGSAIPSLGIESNTDTDTGTVPVMIFNSEVSNSSLSTRPTLAGYNNTTKQWEVSAAGDWNYQGNDINEVANINRTGTIDVDATTGVTLSYNGTTQLSVESGLVEVQNDFDVLGNIDIGDSGEVTETSLLTLYNAGAGGNYAGMRMIVAANPTSSSAIWRRTNNADLHISAAVNTNDLGNNTGQITLSSAGVITMSNYSGTGTEDAQFTSTGALTRIVSDSSYKHTIEPLEVGLSFVLDMAKATRSYYWNDTDLGTNINWGWTAQAANAEVGDNPVFRLNENTGTYGWDSKQMIAPLYNAVSEQQELIEAQQSEIDYLSTKILELIERVETLENNK